MNLQGRASLATNEDLAAYDIKLGELEAELQRRMVIGENFENVLNRQRQLIDDDEKHRENHQVIKCTYSNVNSTNIHVNFFEYFIFQLFSQ